LLADYIDNDKGGVDDGSLFDDVANLDRVSLTQCNSNGFGGGAFVSASNVNTLTINFAQDCPLKMVLVCLLCIHYK
jgi:hypothetical protein